MANESDEEILDKLERFRGDQLSWFLINMPKGKLNALLGKAAPNSHARNAISTRLGELKEADAFVGGFLGAAKGLIEGVVGEEKPGGGDKAALLREKAELERLSQGVAAARRGIGQRIGVLSDAKAKATDALAVTKQALVEAVAKQHGVPPEHLKPLIGFLESRISDPEQFARAIAQLRARQDGEKLLAAAMAANHHIEAKVKEISQAPVTRPEPTKTQSPAAKTSEQIFDEHFRVGEPEAEEPSIDELLRTTRQGKLTPTGKPPELTPAQKKQRLIDQLSSMPEKDMRESFAKQAATPAGIARLQSMLKLLPAGHKLIAEINRVMPGSAAPQPPKIDSVEMDKIMGALESAASKDSAQPNFHLRIMAMIKEHLKARKILENPEAWSQILTAMNLRVKLIKLVDPIGNALVQARVNAPAQPQAPPTVPPEVIAAAKVARVRGIIDNPANIKPIYYELVNNHDSAVAQKQIDEIMAEVAKLSPNSVEAVKRALGHASKAYAEALAKYAEQHTGMATIHDAVVTSQPLDINFLHGLAGKAVDAMTGNPDVAEAMLVIAANPPKRATTAATPQDKPLNDAEIAEIAKDLVGQTPLGREKVIKEILRSPTNGEANLQKVMGNIRKVMKRTMLADNLLIIAKKVRAEMPARPHSESYQAAAASAQVASMSEFYITPEEQASTAELAKLPSEERLAALRRFLAKTFGGVPKDPVWELERVLPYIQKYHPELANDVKLALKPYRKRRLIKTGLYLAGAGLATVMVIKYWGKIQGAINRFLGKPPATYSAIPARQSVQLPARLGKVAAAKARLPRPQRGVFPGRVPRVEPNKFLRRRPGR